VITEIRGVRLLLLAVAMAAGGYVRTTLSPLQEAVRSALALSDNQMGLVQGLALAAPMALLALPIGIVIDRHSRVRLLFLLGLLNVIGTLCSGSATSFATLFGSRILVGLAGYATVPVVMSLLADLYPPAQRGRATMLVSIGQLAGLSGAFGLGGALLAASNPGSDGWRSAMLLLSIPLIPATLLMLAMSEPQRVGPAKGSPSLSEVISELWRFRAVIWPLVLGVVMVETAVGAVLSWSGPTFWRDFGLSADRVGTIMAIAIMVSGIAGPVLGGALADICQRAGGPRQTISALSALALVSAPAGLFPLMGEVSSASVVLVIAMTSYLATSVIGMTLFTIVIPNQIRGLCMTMFVSVQILLALGLGPLTVSSISSAIGGLHMIGSALAIVCLLSSLLATAIFASTRSYFKRAAA
jgi:predicted MFS family arabinose efflux permease